MNFWVLMYIIFAPVFVLCVFVYWNRQLLLKKWWLFKHPQSVYLVRFNYPNRMYVERYISCFKEFFDFQGETYFIKKDALIRKNWLGLRTRDIVNLDEDNCIDFKKYKLIVNYRKEDLPNKAELVGELHFVVGVSNPIVYPDVEDIKNSVKGGSFLNSDKTVGLSLSWDVSKVNKSNVLQQLINANFNKSILILLAVGIVMLIVITGIILALRLELIDAPLHAVCVNVGGG